MLLAKSQPLPLKLLSIQGIQIRNLKIDFNIVVELGIVCKKKKKSLTTAMHLLPMVSEVPLHLNQFLKFGFGFLNPNH